MGGSQSAGWSAEEVCRCGTDEGEAECLRVVEIAQRYYLDPPIQWRDLDGAELEESSASEHRLAEPDRGPDCFTFRGSERARVADRN